MGVKKLYTTSLLIFFLVLILLKKLIEIYISWFIFVLTIIYGKNIFFLFTIIYEIYKIKT